MNEAYGPINKTVESAKLLSGLDSCTIWALIALIMIVYVWWDRKKQFDSNKIWQGIREQQLISETTQTKVLERQTEEIVSLKMLITQYILKD